jgi:hypothetical protein
MQCFGPHNVARRTKSCWDSYGSVWLPLVMQGVSKMLYNGISNVTMWWVLWKIFALKSVQTVRPLGAECLEYHCEALFETSCTFSTFWKNFQMNVPGLLPQELTHFHLNVICSSPAWVLSIVYYVILKRKKKFQLASLYMKLDLISYVSNRPRILCETVLSADVERPSRLRIDLRERYWQCRSLDFRLCGISVWKMSALKRSGNYVFFFGNDDLEAALFCLARHVACLALKLHTSITPCQFQWSLDPGIVDRN